MNLQFDDGEVSFDIEMAALTACGFPVARLGFQSAVGGDSGIGSIAPATSLNPSASKSSSTADANSAPGANDAYVADNADAEVPSQAPADITETNVMESTSATAAPLQRLYKATAGSGWERQNGWSRKSRVKKWTGIELEGDQIVEINLSHNQMRGSLPESIKEFKFLRHLDFQDNELEGTIPDEIFTLGNLTNLNLEHNLLTGAISAKFGRLSQLKTLNLTRNKLTSRLPKALGSLTHLEKLHLSHNSLTGDLPVELGNLTNLQELWIEENLFTGVLPDMFQGMWSLNSFCCRKNQFGGKLPPSLGKAPNLRELMLIDNRYGTNKFREDPGNQRITNYEIKSGSDMLTFKAELTLPVHLPKASEASSLPKAGDKRKETTEADTEGKRGRPRKSFKGPATSSASEGGSSSSTVPLKANSGEAAVKTREKLVAKAETELKDKQEAWERDVKAGKAELAKQQREFEGQKRNQIAANIKEANRLNDLERSIGERTRVVEQHEKDRMTKDANLTKREMAATLMDGALNERARNLEGRVRDLDLKEKGCRDERELLDKEKEALAKEKEDLAQRLAKLANDEQQLKDKEAQWLMSTSDSLPTGGGSSRNNDGGGSSNSSVRHPGGNLCDAMVESGFFEKEEAPELCERLKKCHVASVKALKVQQEEEKVQRLTELAEMDDYQKPKFMEFWKDLVKPAAANHG